MIHIMGDLETLGTKPGCAVIQIGAVKFNATAITDKFNVAIGVASNTSNGLALDGGTVEWWFDPERDAARKVWWGMPKVTLFEACAGFAEWVEETPEDERGSFWGNGASFDSPILQHACKVVGVEWPFSYRQDECFRTMKLRCPQIERPEFIGTPHVAVDDAESQAVHLQMICGQLGIRL